MRFADDQAMIASSELGLQTIMDGLVKVAKQYDMKINVKKTKVMSISKTGEGDVGGGTAGRTSTKFKYLGSLIEADGRCQGEIRARIGMAKDTLVSGKRS